MAVSAVADIYSQPLSMSTQSTSTLDRDAFLRLFVEQLKNQDPTSPQDSSAMINQMAQFSILEQLTNIGTDIEQIKLSQQMGEASALLGKQVTVQTSEGEISGQVEKVSIYDEEVWISIDGISYGVDQVTEIK